MARRGWIKGVVCVLGVLVAGAPAAGAEVDPYAAPEARGVPPGLKISAGIDQKRGWVTAEYGDLRISKSTHPGGSSNVEFKYGDDLVVFDLRPGAGHVARNGRRVELGNGGPVESTQRLLGDSQALYHTRVMLSQLEATSALTPPEMTVLTVAAFAAAITGDTEAPLRLSERFMARHVGGVRPVRFVPGGSCSSDYTAEVSDAHGDMMSCKAAALDSWFWQVKVALCELSWLGRVESAWFEFLKCTGLMAIIAE